MNRIIVALMPFLFGLVGYKATAQDTEKEKVKEKKQVEEIVVRKSGEKDATVTIQFKDDKVLINGKPMVEFNDNDITINKRKIMSWDGDRLMVLGDKLDALREIEGFQFDLDNEDMHARLMPSMGSRTFLGVTTETNDKGALIKSVTKESAAEKAGLKEGDIITAIEKEKISGPEDLSKTISAKKPKDEVKITYLRDGKEKSVKAALGERKEVMARSFSFSSPDVKAYGIPRVPGQGGAAIAPYRWEQDYFNLASRSRLGIKIQDTEDGNGVKVLEVEEGSAAEKAGVKKDDVVTRIGDKDVKTTDDAREQLAANRDKASYPVVVKRNNSEMKFEIKIPKKLKTANL